MYPAPSINNPGDPFLALNIKLNQREETSIDLKVNGEIG
jgi:hypothetical protein